MKKIAFIIPYFGNELPAYFEPFLITCEGNPTIDFFIFTDDKRKFIDSKNVFFIYCTWKEMKEKVQKCFDFIVSLDSPYKLCDYRPAYGEIFADYLGAYDFWGHCDIDLIWGDIRKFIPDSLLERYDRIGTNGSFTLYRNADVVNTYYRCLPCKNNMYYKDVYTTHDLKAFDEVAEHNGGGMTCILEDNGVKVASNPGRWSTIDYKCSCFRTPYYKEFVIHYQKGKLFTEKKGKKMEELPYFHYHLRKKAAIVESCSEDFYLVSPCVFTNETGSKKKHYMKRINWKLYWIGRDIRIFLGAYKRKAINFISRKR